MLCNTKYSLKERLDLILNNLSFAIHNGNNVIIESDIGNKKICTSVFMRFYHVFKR
jgi:hypothetical protein